MALLATGNRDDALELVQDAMLALARRYAHRPHEEWAPVFHRILQRRISDWRRRRAVRERWVSLWGDRGGDGEPEFPDPRGRTPEREHEDDVTLTHLQQAIGRLPPRQQQALLLRAWEGFDVRETAHAMGCSEGSVKTHYSRALNTLRQALGDRLP